MRTCHDIVVACQVLGARVDDDVCTQGQGFLVDGGGESGVDAHERAMRPAELRYPGDVHAAQVGVGGGLCVGKTGQGLLCGQALRTVVQGYWRVPSHQANLRCVCQRI